MTGSHTYIDVKGEGIPNQQQKSGNCSSALGKI
jgi:hypothetical protein